LIIYKMYKMLNVYVMLINLIYLILKSLKMTNHILDYLETLNEVGKLDVLYFIFDSEQYILNLEESKKQFLSQLVSQRLKFEEEIERIKQMEIDLIKLSKKEFIENYKF
jgi:hypothetical protein